MKKSCCKSWIIEKSGRYLSLLIAEPTTALIQPVIIDNRKPLFFNYGAFLYLLSCIFIISQNRKYPQQATISHRAHFPLMHRQYRWFVFNAVVIVAFGDHGDDIMSPRCACQEPVPLLALCLSPNLLLSCCCIIDAPFCGTSRGLESISNPPAPFISAYIPR